MKTTLIPVLAAAAALALAASHASAQSSPDNAPHALPSPAGPSTQSNVPKSTPAPDSSPQALPTPVQSPSNNSVTPVAEPGNALPTDKAPLTADRTPQATPAPVTEPIKADTPPVLRAGDSALKDYVVEAPSVNDVYPRSIRASNPMVPPSAARYIVADPRLRTPIHVEMTQATIQQAMQALSTAAGIPIRVEKDAAFGGKLSVAARSAPLWTVLEGIAEQTHLMIERSGNGYALSSPPSLTINGQRRSMDWPGAPWANIDDSVQAQDRTLLNQMLLLETKGNKISDGYQYRPPPLIDGTALSWNNVPTYYDMSGLISPGANEQSANLYYAPPTAASPAPQSNYTPVPMGPGSGSKRSTAPLGNWMGDGISMTALGDRMFVVAEPTRGPNGVPGYQLTVYRLDSADKMKKVSSIFHAAADRDARSTGMSLFLNNQLSNDSLYRLQQQGFISPNNLNTWPQPLRLPTPEATPVDLGQQLQSARAVIRQLTPPAKPTPPTTPGIGAPQENDDPIEPPIRIEIPASPADPTSK